MQVDSLLIRVDAQSEAERLTTAGGDVLTWTGVVPSAEGGEITWASAVVRLPVDAAVRLGLITLGAGLRESLDAATEPAPTAPTTTTPATVTQTSTGTPLVAPRGVRSARPGRRRRHRITCDTATKDRAPSAPTPDAMRP